MISIQVSSLYNVSVNNGDRLKLHLEYHVDENEAVWRDSGDTILFKFPLGSNLGCTSSHQLPPLCESAILAAYQPSWLCVSHLGCESAILAVYWRLIPHCLPADYSTIWSLSACRSVTL